MMSFMRSHYGERQSGSDMFLKEMCGLTPKHYRTVVHHEWLTGGLNYGLMVSTGWGPKALLWYKGICLAGALACLLVRCEIAWSERNTVCLRHVAGHKLHDYQSGNRTGTSVDRITFLPVVDVTWNSTAMGNAGGSQPGFPSLYFG